MRITPKTISRAAILLVVIAVLGYTLFEARGYLIGPVIEVTTPKDGDIVTRPLIHIEGRAERILSMTINGRSMFVNDLGYFSEPVTLLSGKNVITITATDRFGETQTETLVVFYRPTTPLAPVEIGTSTLEENFTSP